MNAYDSVVIGGGPSGATSAADLAAARHSALPLNRAGQIKPCGGTIPPRLIRDFAIPDHLIVGRSVLSRLYEQAPYLCRPDSLLAHFLHRYAAHAANSAVIQP